MPQWSKDNEDIIEEILVMSRTGKHLFELVLLVESSTVTFGSSVLALFILLVRHGESSYYNLFLELRKNAED